MRMRYFLVIVLLASFSVIDCTFAANLSSLESSVANESQSSNMLTPSSAIINPQPINQSTASQVVSAKANQALPSLVSSSKVIIKPSVPTGPVKTWVIRADDRMISNTLSRWAQDSGYQLVWNTPIDFPVNAEAKIHGTFRYALNEVLKSFKYTKNPLRADWYLNNVIVIRPFD